MEGLLASLTFGMNVQDAAFKAALASDRDAMRQTERQFHSSGDAMTNAMTTTAREVNRAALAMVDGFHRAVDQIKAKGVALTVALTVPLGLLSHGSKEAASSFEEAMNRVHAAMLTAKPEQLQKLSEAALTMGPAMGRSAIEAAEAIESLAKNGMSAADILNGGLKSALTLATVGQTDLGAASDATTDILQQFHLATGDLPNVVNKVSGALDASKLSFNGYKDAIGMVGGIAGGLGYSFEDMNTALAAVIPLMTGGSDAGTSFKTFLLSLVPSSKEASAEMDRLGIKFFDAEGNVRSLSEVAEILNTRLSGLNQQARQEALTKMFGTDGMRVALALMQAGAKGIANVKTQIDGVTADQKMAVLLDGEAAATNRLAAAWQTLGIRIGEAGLIQIMTAIKNAIAGTLESLASAPPAVFYLVNAFGAMVAAAGPMLVAFGAVIGVVGPMVASMLLLRSGLGLVGIALSAIINPLGLAGRMLLALGLRAAGAFAVARLGAMLLGLLSPVNLLIAAIAILLPRFMSLSELSDNVRKAQDSQATAHDKATAAIDRLSTATGKARDQALAHARALQAEQIQLLKTAQADVAKARAEYLHQRDAENSPRVSWVARIASQLWGGRNRTGAARDLVAANDVLKGYQADAAALADAIKAAENAPAGTNGPSLSDDGKGSPRSGGRAANVRDAAQDAARREAAFQDQLGQSRVEILRTDAEIAQTAKSRHRAELAALAEESAAYGRRVALDSDLTDAQRASLLAAREKQDVSERALIDTRFTADAAQEEYDLLSAGITQQQEELRARSQIADSVAERRRIELQLLDLQKKQEAADIERILAGAATGSAAWDAAFQRKQGLDARYAAMAAGAARQNEGPGASYLREVRASSDALNERLQDGVVASLRGFNSELTDALMGTKSLGDAFVNMGKRILATLLDIAIQQSLIRPLAESFFGGGSASLLSAGAGIVEGDQTTQGNQSWLKSLGGFLRLFGGGRAAGGGVRDDEWYLVGEKGPELFAPGVSGTVIPNHALPAPKGGGDTYVDLRGAYVDQALWDRVDQMASYRAGQALTASMDHTQSALAGVARQRL